MTRLAGVLLIAALMVQGEEPRFTDPERRAKLQSAFPEIDLIFERYKENRSVPGLVYGIVIDGGLSHLKAFGVRDVQTGDPVAASTVFRIASMTKSFTALAILKLRDEGKLSLEDPVSKWIPEFERMQYATRDTAPIRIRQLLTHGAGFPEDNPWGDQQLGVSEEELTRWLREGIPASTPADTAYEYSNYGFALAGRIVSKVSGQPYREYLEQQILAPLGMKASTLEASAVPPEQRAVGYRRLADGRYQEEKPLPHGAFGSMGGLHVSANDLGRYIAFMLSAWPPRDEEDRGPVRRSSVREMQQLWRPSDLTASRPEPDGPLQVITGGYGYGLRISRSCSFRHIVGHGGGLPGYGSYMQWLPDYGVGFFAMANLTYSAPAPAINEALAVLLKTGGLAPRKLPAVPVLTSTRDSIVKLWRAWDDDSAGRLAANNLFLDVPADNRKQEMESIRKRVGACRKAGEVQPENLLRGTFRMDCERGFVDVTFTLAPTNPPRVQHLRFAQAVEPSNRLKEIARVLASQVASEDRLREWAAPALDIRQLQRRMSAIRSAYGGCRPGPLLGGDGERGTTLRFDCDRGPVNVSIDLSRDGKLTGVHFAKPAEQPCVP